MFDKFKSIINEVIKIFYLLPKRIYYLFYKSHLNIKTFIRIQSKRWKVAEKKRKFLPIIKRIFWRVLPYFLGWLVLVWEWYSSGSYYTRCFF